MRYFFSEIQKLKRGAFLCTMFLGRKESSKYRSMRIGLNFLIALLSFIVPSNITNLFNGLPCLNLPLLPYLRTATSFLKACSCAGVGSFTLSLLTATGPCHWPLYTVPNEPDPIRGPILMSTAGISHSSLESRRAR